ncbi:hypothetical protein MXD81_05430 [Microbacteriaceae bacterium K1510]|nr:hypothetical protein [Microbacteriaceae bacterium K1510]
MGDAMRQSVGLARAGAGDDQQRRRVVEELAAMLDRAALLSVQLGQIAGRGGSLTIRAKFQILQALSPLRDAVSLSYKA